MALDATGIIAALKGLEGSFEVKVGAAFINTGDIKRELGITLEDQQYAARLEALTKPSDYYSKRKALIRSRSANTHRLASPTM